MADLLMMELVFHGPRNAFVRHGYLQHASVKYLGHVNLRCQLKFAPDDLVLTDAVLFAYKWSLKMAYNADPVVIPAQEKHISISVLVPEDLLLYTLLLESYVHKRVYYRVIRCLTHYSNVVQIAQVRIPSQFLRQYRPVHGMRLLGSK